MMRIAGVIVVALLAAGCATNKSVKQQIAPLADRVTALEKQQAAVDAKKLNATQAEIVAKLDAQRSELEALRRELAAASANNARMQESVNEAQLAAARAETAAQKSAKAFELSQGKGAKK